jgi:alkyl-hydroperoxide reductase/thiol specific antioxidant family protein
LREHEADFKRAGAQLAAVGMGDRPYAQAFREETGIGFPLLIDEQRRAYRAASLKSASLLHLFYRANAAARTRAKQGGHHQHRLGQHPFQLGGSFVFAPGNVDRFAHVSTTFGDNAAPDTLLAAVRG